jgi:hypothetical protein
MSDDKETKSWKERDLMRDRGQKFEHKSSKREEFAQKRASTAAKKDLEKLFSGSKVNKEKSKRLEQIKLLRGKPDYYAELTKFFEEYGAPLELEIQLLFLDHRDSNIVIQVIEEMKTTSAREPIEKQKTLLSKLKVMEISTFDSNLIDKIAELKKTLLVK